MSGQNVQSLSPQEIAQQLNDWFLSGKGRVTQMPGEAAPETRKFYKTHKGFDLAVPQGTKLNTDGLEVLGTGMDNTGYGQRIALYDPNKNQTVFASHLSKVVQRPDGGYDVYSGGVPGTYGAGNTTGAHVDFVVAQGRQPLSFANSIKVPNYGGTPGAQAQTDPQQLLAQARSQYGKNIIGISSDPKRLEEIAKKRGGRIIKINI